MLVATKTLQPVAKDGRIEIYATALMSNGTHKLVCLGKTTLSGKISKPLAEKIKSLVVAPLVEPAQFHANDIFNSKGRPADVTLYNGYWSLFKNNGPSVSIKANSQSLTADIAYLALRICLRRNIPENSVTHLVIKHALRSMYGVALRGHQNVC